jgi:TPR repeat protein/serine/threonine protein kinase
MEMYAELIKECSTILKSLEFLCEELSSKDIASDCRRLCLRSEKFSEIISQLIDCPLVLQELNELNILRDLSIVLLHILNFVQGTVDKYDGTNNAAHLKGNGDGFPYNELLDYHYRSSYIKDLAKLNKQLVDMADPLNLSHEIGDIELNRLEDLEDLQTSHKQLISLIINASSPSTMSGSSLSLIPSNDLYDELQKFLSNQINEISNYLVFIKYRPLSVIENKKIKSETLSLSTMIEKKRNDFLSSSSSSPNTAIALTMKEEKDRKSGGITHTTSGGSSISQPLLIKYLLALYDLSYEEENKKVKIINDNKLSLDAITIHFHSSSPAFNNCSFYEGEYNYNYSKALAGKKGRKTLGNGASVGKNGKEKILVKILQGNDHDTTLENEIILLEYINQENHSNLLKFYGFSLHGSFSCLLFEKPMILGNLSSFLTNYHRFFLLKQQKGKTLSSASSHLLNVFTEYFHEIPLSLLLAWFNDLISALHYLHSNGIIHGSLLPENILITSSYHCKLTNFSIASELLSKEGSMEVMKEQLRNLRGNSIVFIAPEVRASLTEGQQVEEGGEEEAEDMGARQDVEEAKAEKERKGLVDPSSDIYSLCMIYYYMLSLKYPSVKEAEDDMEEHVAETIHSFASYKLGVCPASTSSCWENDENNFDKFQEIMTFLQEILTNGTSYHPSLSISSLSSLRPSTTILFKEIEKLLDIVHGDIRRFDHIRQNELTRSFHIIASEMFRRMKHSTSHSTSGGTNLNSSIGSSSSELEALRTNGKKGMKRGVSKRGGGDTSSSFYDIDDMKNRMITDIEEDLEENRNIIDNIDFEETEYERDDSDDDDDDGDDSDGDDKEESEENTDDLVKNLLVVEDEEEEEEEDKDTFFEERQFDNLRNSQSMDDIYQKRGGSEEMESFQVVTPSLSRSISFTGSPLKKSVSSMSSANEEEVEEEIIRNDKDDLCDLPSPMMMDRIESLNSYLGSPYQGSPSLPHPQYHSISPSHKFSLERFTKEMMMSTSSRDTEEEEEKHDGERILSNDTIDIHASTGVKKIQPSAFPRVYPSSTSKNVSSSASSSATSSASSTKEKKQTIFSLSKKEQDRAKASNSSKPRDNHKNTNSNSSSSTNDLQRKILFLNFFREKVACLQSRAEKYSSILISNHIHSLELLKTLLMKNNQLLINLGFDSEDAFDISDVLLSSSEPFATAISEQVERASVEHTDESSISHHSSGLTDSVNDDPYTVSKKLNLLAEEEEEGEEQQQQNHDSFENRMNQQWNNVNGMPTGSSVRSRTSGMISRQPSSGVSFRGDRTSTPASRTGNLPGRIPSQAQQLLHPQTHTLSSSSPSYYQNLFSNQMKNNRKSSSSNGNSPSNQSYHRLDMEIEKIINKNHQEEIIEDDLDRMIAMPSNSRFNSNSTDDLYTSSSSPSTSYLQQRQQHQQGYHSHQRSQPFRRTPSSSMHRTMSSSSEANGNRFLLPSSPSGFSHHHHPSASFYLSTTNNGKSNQEVFLPSELSNIYYRATQCYDRDALTKLFYAASKGEIIAEGYIMRIYALGQAAIEQDYEIAQFIGNRIISWIRTETQSPIKYVACNAQFLLGCCYSEGLGVPKDEKEAFFWYKEAAMNGFSLAQAYLGYCYFSGKGILQNQYEAVYWYTLAAKEGHSSAQTNLGICYEKGYGTKKDEIIAVKWYSLAAEQEDISAQYNLAYCYERGIGNLEQNQEKSFMYYELAASKGHTIAQCHLASFYETGVVVTQDNTEAFHWYLLSAEKGYLPSIIKVGCAYEHGIGVVANPFNAVEWYLKAAMKGSAQGEYYLATCYSMGTGMNTPDLTKAIELYSLSAEKGYAPAQNNLGFMYRQGKSCSLLVFLICS